MPTRELLSIISRHINSTGSVIISCGSGYPLKKLVDEGLLEHVYCRQYSIKFTQFLKRTLVELGLHAPDIRDTGALHYCEDLYRHSAICLYFVAPHNYEASTVIGHLSSLIAGATSRCLAVVPFLFADNVTREGLLRPRSIESLSNIYMYNLKVFSLPILLPYPEVTTAKNGKRIDLFDDYRKALNETRKALEALPKSRYPTSTPYSSTIEYSSGQKFWYQWPSWTASSDNTPQSGLEKPGKHPQSGSRK